MGWWKVTGENEGQFFQIGESGYSASGRGQHHYGHFGWELKELASVRDLPATWSVYHAKDSASAASLIGLNVSDMKMALDPEAVRLTKKPVWVIKKYEDSVGFAAFLPDSQFHGVISWLEKIACGAPMSYQFNFGFSGLMPQPVLDRPEMVSSDEWLKGRPYVRIGDDFGFGVSPIVA